VRLARLLDELLPNQSEIEALYALMLFHDARRQARVNASGEPVLLEDQDRSLWESAKISRGMALLARDVTSSWGPYRVQASIVAEHVRAENWKATDWRRICRYYDILLAIDPSPVVELNRAVAVAYAQGYETGLALMDELKTKGFLDDYAPLFSARAELLRRARRTGEARAAYARAIELTRNEPERRYLRAKLAELGPAAEA